jgi:ABC-type polysaccharide/polyol phosphate export permease
MAINLGRALVAPFRVLHGRREAIQFFVVRDIRARYVNSVLGVWWAVIQPLALLLLYTFIFSRIMNVRFGAGEQGNFSLYLFCGLLPWLAFSDAIVRSTSVLEEQAPLVKKIVFPAEILPVYIVLSGLVVEFVGLVVLLGAVLVWAQPPGWTVLWLPLVVVLQFIFTVGVAWLLATVTVFVPDVRPALNLLLTLWMFLTPIVYPASMVPERFRWVMALNPMAYVVDAYRGAVLDHRAPALLSLGAFAVIAVAAFLGGYWSFSRFKQTFADFL